MEIAADIEEKQQIREEEKRRKKEKKEEEKKKKQQLVDEYRELLRVPHWPTYNEFQEDVFPSIASYLRHKIGVQHFQRIELDVIDKLSAIWTTSRKDVKLYAKLMADIKDELGSKHFDSDEERNAFIRTRKTQLMKTHHDPNVLYQKEMVIDAIEKQFENEISTTTSAFTHPETESTTTSGSNNSMAISLAATIVMSLN